MEPSLMQGMKYLYGGKYWILFFLIIEEGESMKPKKITFVLTQTIAELKKHSSKHPNPHKLINNK